MSRSRSTPIVIAVLAVGAPLLMWMRPFPNVYVTGGVGGATVAVAFATAAVTFGRYRSTHDPHDLLTGTGLTAIGVQTALFLFGYYRWNVYLERWLDNGAIDFKFDLTRPLIWEAGWLAAGTLALFAHPRRDRRGRRPIRWKVVVAATGSVLLVVDAGLLIVRPRIPWGEASFDWVFTGWIGIRGPSPVPAMVCVLGIAAAILCGASAIREVRGRGAPHLRFGVGFALGSLALVGTAFRPILGISGFLTVSEVLALLAVILVFTGVLGVNRAESSRMRRATDRAAEVMEGRAEIASVIAHDVRGPASTIKGLATTTRKSYDRLGDAERIEFVGMIEQEAERLLTLVNQTALALKVDAGTLAPSPREQELAPLVRQAVADAGVGAHRVDVEAPAGILASVDTRWFVEAVRQAVDNAAKYSPEDTPIRVRLTQEDDGAALLDIADGGPGIPPEQRDAVFEKFVRWRPAGYEDRTGSGLGLFICRGIIHEHGGETGIVGATDGGTILRIRLPRRGEQEP